MIKEKKKLIPPLSTDGLFSLIKSLGKAEKRYFKIFASKFKNNNINVILFDIFEKEEVYNKEKIMLLAGIQSDNIFNSNKHTLYHLVLKSLRAYHSNHPVEILLLNGLRNVEILFKKAQYNYCDNELQKLKRIAEKNKKYNLLFELLSWERRLIKTVPSLVKNLSVLDVIHDKERVTLEKVENINSYELLFSEMIEYLDLSTINPKSEEAIALYREIIGNRLLSDKKYATTLKSKILFGGISSLILYANNELEKAFAEMFYFITQMDAYEDTFEGGFYFYTFILNKMFSTSIQLGNETYFLKSYNKFSELPNKYPLITSNDNQSIFFARQHIHFLEFYYVCKKYDVVLNKLPEIEKFLTDMETPIPSDLENRINYYISISAFYNNKYQLSLLWNNKISNASKQKNEDLVLKSFSKILNMMIHFEYDKSLLLPIVIRTYEYFKSEKKQFGKLEKLMLQFFKKIIHIDVPADLSTQFKALKEKLEILIKEDKSKYYVDVLAWVNTKL